MEISKNHLHELARLRQKKYRLAEGRVIVEGERALSQIRDYGISPLEQYVGQGQKPLWSNIAAWELNPGQFSRICESEHPAGYAALLPVPVEREEDFRIAFYLDGIADPGNLGSIFRVAAAFGIGMVYVSPDCAELSSPKVIRSSLGAVYRVPFRTFAQDRIGGLGARVVAAEMRKGFPLRQIELRKDEKVIVALGSEAHGISAALLSGADESWHIEMGDSMESLNVSVAAGIIAHHLSQRHFIN